MIIVASSNGLIGVAEAMRVLRGGGSALDAVEAGIHLVEDNAADHGVSYGGWPNLVGEMELDASVMDGRTLQAGAVAAIKGYRHPISVARKVMETLPHVLLAGEGASRFAAEMGFPLEDILSDEARAGYLKIMGQHMSEEQLSALASGGDLCPWVQVTTDPDSSLGTVNFIGMDGNGDIANGVSTSGWAWKYPGRVGDSPLIGAGSYCDNRYGAACCTGMGEMSIRMGTARSLVLYMKMGMSLEEAGRTAMEDLRSLQGEYLSHMHIVALDRDGRPAGFTNDPGKTFVYMTDEMADPVEAPRTVVETPKRWGEADRLVG